MVMRGIWNPASEFVSLREAMDQLVADSVISPRSLLGSVGNGMGLPASLYENGEGYIVQVMIPGVDQEKVEITTRGATLRIKGERVAPQLDGARQIWSGIGYGPFEQTFSLPTAVEPSGAQADYENGLLTLRLPKAQHARAHTIAIGKGSQKAIEAGASK